MSIGQFQLQSAIYTALNVSAITSTLSCGVYDEVTEGNTYPFISLGEETAIDYGTKDLNGGEYTINIHITNLWKYSKSNEKSKAENRAKRVGWMLQLIINEEKFAQ